MNNSDQTTVPLIEELAQLRRQVAELQAQDITAWKQAETALRASEGKYRRLYESLMDAFVRVGMDGRILEFNEAFRQMVGYEPEELRTLTYIDITPERWHTLQAKIIQEQVLQRGYSDVYEKEYRRKDGTLVPIELRTYLVADENGKPTVMWAIMRDITARKQAALALQESEERFRKVFDEGPVGVTLVGLDGGVRRCNQRFCEMLGYAETEIIALGMPGITHPADLETDHHLWVKLFRGEIPSYCIEKRYLREDGQVIWGQWTASMMHAADGKPTAVIGIVEDITARKKAEEAMCEAEQTFRMLMDASPESVLLLDTSGRIVLANETTAQRLGRPMSDIVGRTAYDLFPAEVAANRMARIEEVVRTGRVVRFDDLRLGRYVENAVYPIFDEQGKIIRVAALGIDRTERKRNEEALQRAHEDLERKVKERTAELAIFRRFMEASGRGFGMADLTGNITYVNATLCRLFGEVQPEDVIGKHVCTYYPEEYRQRRENEIIPALLREGSWQGEQEVLSRNGTRIPTFQNTFLIRDENGQPSHFGVAVADISELKRAESALRVSEERFELAARGAGVGIWDWNLRTGKVYYSPRWKSMFGYEENEIGDELDDWARLLHPDEREWILKFQADFLAGVLPTVAIQYRLRHKDGSYRWIEANGLVVRDEQGRACRFVGSHGDITDRRRAEDALRESEAKHRALIESCPDSVVMVDLQGRIVFASHRAAEQHGFLNSEELVGSSALNLMVEEDRDRFKANIGRLLAEGIHRNVSYRGLRKDGTVFEAEISSAVIRDAAGTPVALMGVYRDVTQRRQAEARLRAKDAELLAAAEIQAHLLPQKAPQVPGFDIAGRCYPAEAAAGDHFDYLWLPDGSLLVVMGDVSGHGIGPAIVAADFCARLRTLSESMCDLPEIARRVNAGLYRETAGEKFVTAILGRLDPKSRSLTYVSAGHPPAVVLNSAGEVKGRLVRAGLSLSIVAETSYVTDDPLQLADGDLILFYTDGLVEVGRCGEPLFGVDRALQVIQANRDRSAAEIIEALYEAACQFGRPDSPHDDITIVIVKVLASSTGDVGAFAGDA